MLIRPYKPDDRDTLVDVWLRSVRATHAFLSEEQIQAMLPLVRDEALPALDVSVLVDAGRPLGFVGTSGDKLEALFLAPEIRRRGGGRMLVEHVRAGRTLLLVDVNEQNPQATAFYEGMGFVRVGRSELDGQGQPFPLLHLRWDAPAITPRLPTGSPPPRRASAS